MPSGRNILFLDFYVDLASAIQESTDEKELKDKIKFLIDEHQCYKFSDEQIDKAVLNNDSSHLFLLYKNAPAKVKNVAFIENLLRKIWLYNVCANYYKAITMDDLAKTVEKKFDDEKSFNKELISPFFCLFTETKKYKNNDFLYELGKFYSQYINYFNEAYTKFENFFNGDEEKAYLKFIYNFDTAKEDPVISNKEKLLPKQKKNKEVPLLTSCQIEQLVTEYEGLQEKIVSLTEENKSLNDIVDTLNFEKRNLEIKNNYAMKDTIRELLNSLNNQSWNSPLGELYLQSLREDLDDKTKGIIINLFNSLGDIGIKIVKEKEIGKEIIMTSENQRAYDPAKNEDIYLNDKVIVVYPGYRYKNETMIRPMVKKVKEEK